eukprot:gene30875-41081_t
MASRGSRAALFRADLAFGASQQPLDVFAVHEPQQQGHDGRQHGELRGGVPPQENRRDDAGGQCRERRVARGEGAGEPGQAEHDRGRKEQAEHDADIDGDALAALEVQPDREEVAEKGGEPGDHRRCRSRTSSISSRARVSTSSGNMPAVSEGLPIRAMTDTIEAPATAPVRTPPIFVVSVFTSAALVFMVQPMVAKLVLPLLGGSPAVWNTSMAFFQIALLIGYGYAHFLQKISSVRRQITVHITALAIAGLTLFPLSISGL